MTTLLAAALLGFCSTTVDSVKVCSTIEKIDPKEHLIEKCAPWAKSIGGKGWSYANSYSHSELADKQKSRCDRIEKIDEGKPYACQATMYCDGHFFPYDFGVEVKARTQDEAIDKCIDKYGDKYDEVLKETGRARCFMIPLGDYPLKKVK